MDMNKDKRTPRSSKCRVAEVNQKPWNPAQRFRNGRSLFFSAELLTMRVVRIFCNMYGINDVYRRRKHVSLLRFCSGSISKEITTWSEEGIR